MTSKNNKIGNMRNISALGFVSFFNDLASEMIYPLLPYFLVVRLGAGPVGLGLIEGIAETTASVLKFYSGLLSDRLAQRKPIIFIGYLVSNALRPLIGFVSAWWHVLFIRFADRIGKGVRSAPRDALLADSASLAKRAFAFSFQRAMDHTGALLGPVVAWFLLSGLNFSHERVFFFSAIPGAMVLLVIIFFVKEMPRLTNHSKSVAGQEVTEGVNGNQKVAYPVKRRKGFCFFLCIIVLFTLGNSTDAFLLLLAERRGVSVALIPLLWGLLSLSKIAFSFFGGWIADRWSKRATIVLGWLVYALVYAGFSISTSAFQIWLLFGLYGIYFGLTEGVEKALVADIASSREYGKAFGLYNLTIGIGALPASLLFGLIWHQFGFRVAFLFGAGLALVSAFLLSILKMGPVRHAE